MVDLKGSKKQLFAELETDAPCVCAIDFGTARTGYAYAFTRRPGVYEANFSCHNLGLRSHMTFNAPPPAPCFPHTPYADEIKVKEPGGQEPGKTHTSLLLDERGSFLAFGSKAREDYYEW